MANKKEMIHRAFIKEAVKLGYKATVYELEDEVNKSNNVESIIECAECTDEAIIEWYDEKGTYIGNIGIVMGNDDPCDSVYDYHCNIKIESIMDRLYKLYE